MAKKKKKVQEEKYEFVPPDFDERQFLVDEMKATRRVLVTVAYGSFLGGLTGFVTSGIGLPSLGFLFFIFGLVAIKYVLPIAGVDLLKFTKKTWLESGAWYFFTFLAVWVLVLNPPFADYAQPEVDDVQIGISNDGGLTWHNYTYTFNLETGVNEWKRVNVTSPVKPKLEIGWTVNISAMVADNWGLAGNPSVQIGSRAPTTMLEAEANQFYYQIQSLSEGDLIANNYFTFKITASDRASNTATFEVDTQSQVLVS